MSRLRISALLALPLVAALLLLTPTGCGWKGEPLDGFAEAEADTVYNDLTYTAVTGSMSSVSAIAADLRGFINTTRGPLEETSEFGFLLSRDNPNPSRGDADETSPGKGRVRRIAVYEVAADNSIRERVYGLIPYTKFYFRTYAVLRDGSAVYGVVKSFMTLPLSLTISDPPTRVGVFDAELAVKVSGLGDDYGTSAALSFRCADCPIESPTAAVEGAAYDKTVEAHGGRVSEWPYVATFDGLIPGRQYYALAFMTIDSEFYDDEADNPFVDGKFTYGVEAAAVRTDKFRTAAVALVATALAGVRSFTGDEAEVDYDAVTIAGNYFVLPSDTLEASEYGVRISTSEEFPDDETRICPSTEELGQGKRYGVFVNGLDLNTKYYYKAYVSVRGLTVVSQTVCSFATKNYSPTAVDLGLSVAWADKNVGAWAKEIAGTYYSWGETSQKEYYYDETFSGAGLDIANIGGTSLDAATAKWGAGWRLPTTSEVEELRRECEWKWRTVEGVPGFEITGPNESKIFLPACGLMIRDRLLDSGETGYYWTSERAEGDKSFGQVYDMYIRDAMQADETIEPLHTCSPALGLCVRAVYDGR